MRTLILHQSIKQTYASRLLPLLSISAPTDTLLPPTAFNHERDEVNGNWYWMTGTVCLYCYGFLKGPFHQRVVLIYRNHRMNNKMAQRVISVRA